MKLSMLLKTQEETLRKKLKVLRRSYYDQERHMERQLKQLRRQRKRAKTFEGTEPMKLTDIHEGAVKRALIDREEAHLPGADMTSQKIHDEFKRLYALKNADLEKEVGPLSHRSNSKESAIFFHLSKKYGESAFQKYLELDEKNTFE